MPDWLLSHGQHWVTVPEAAQLLGIPQHHVAPTLARARTRGLLFSPTRGAYVPIPAEYRSWRAVPASHFIDALMHHLGHSYYVGLLSAAEIHGVAHQHPQVFQVVTSARLAGRTFGRVRLEFITAAHSDRRPTVAINTPTGTMRVSTPEVTALDLVASPLHGGGLSNVATVLGEMLEEDRLDLTVLADVAAAYPAAVRQRTGFLLDDVSRRVGVSVDLAALAHAGDARQTPTPLASSGPRRGRLDPRWNVIVNTDVEPEL
jgi:predicted transcriptional regulator of viral defense system